MEATLMDPWESFVARLLELLQEDKELHRAVVRVLDCHSEVELARADHEKALAERARRKEAVR